MNARPIAALAAAAALAGCGHAADSTTFTAPPNFRSVASIGPFMQIWEAGPENSLILFALPVKTNLDNAMQQAQVKDVQDMHQSKIAICGGQPAMFMTAQGVASTGAKDSPPSQIEMVVTDINGKTFMAMYDRPLHAPADPAAEAAIKNICAKQG
jgi:hypothetical protein